MARTNAVASRRAFLAGAASLAFVGGGGLAAPRRALARAPDAATDGCTPEQFDERVGQGDPAVDTAALNKAVAYAIENRTPLFIRRNLMISPRVADGPALDYRGRRANPMFAAVVIKGSGLRVVGQGGSIRFRKNGEAYPPGALTALFATPVSTEDIRRQRDPIRNLSFEDLTIDFDDIGDKRQALPSLYGFAISGVQNLSLRRCRFTSTGRNAGWGGFFYNVSGYDVDGCVYRNIRQGMNCRYVYGARITNLTFDKVVEGVDFDGVVSDFVIDGVTFDGGIDYKRAGMSSQQSQVLDLNSATSGVVTNIRAKDVHNIVRIVDKPTTWPTFDKFLSTADLGAKDPAREPNPLAVLVSRDIVIRGVRGERIGTAGGNVAIGIGSGRSTPGDRGRPPIENITISDVELIDTGPIELSNDGRNVLFENIRMTNVVRHMPPAAKYYGAISAQSGRAEVGGEIAATFRNIRIDGCDNIGINVDGASRVTLEDVQIRDANRSGAPETAFGVKVAGASRRGGAFETRNVVVSEVGGPSPQSIAISRAGVDRWDDRGGLRLFRKPDVR